MESLIISELFVFMKLIKTNNTGRALKTTWSTTPKLRNGPLAEWVILNGSFRRSLRTPFFGKIGKSLLLKGLLPFFRKISQKFSKKGVFVSTNNCFV